METFSRDGISELRNIFALMDRDERGKVSTKEIEQLLNSQNCYPNEAELGEMITEMDFDRDGEINFEDLVTYCSQRRSSCSASNSYGELKRAFDFLDYNGDGYVSATDLRHVMHMMGRDVTEEEAERMLAEVDAAASGRISYECFKNKMLEGVS